MGKEEPRKKYVVRQGYVVKGVESGVFHEPGAVLELTDKEAEAHAAQIETYNPELHGNEKKKDLTKPPADRAMKGSPVSKGKKK